MYILSINVQVTLNKEIIEAACRILHDADKKVNKTNVLNELRYILKEKGTLGIEYIYDRNVGNKSYKGLRNDTDRICKQLSI